MEKEITSSSEPESRYCTSLNEAVNTLLKTVCTTQQKQEKNDSLKTGFGNLEFYDKELIILAARPYIGKSAFVLSMIKQICLDSKQSVGLIIPGNIDDTKVSEKLISICSQIPSAKIRYPAALDDEKITEAPLYVMNIPNCSLSDIKISINSMVEKSAKLIVIEGFEFLKEIVDSDQKWYREDLEHMLVHLKYFAEGFNVPILVVMDLPWTEDGYEPRLTDFKKYMIIPRTADKVLFIFRDQLRDEVLYQDAKVVIAKNNNGEVGDIHILFHPATNSFIYSENLE